jgi:hypothetical protein
MLIDQQNQRSEMSTLLKAIYMCNTSPLKIPMTFFPDTEKINPKFHTEAQRTVNSQTNPGQKQQCCRRHYT